MHCHARTPLTNRKTKEAHLPCLVRRPSFVLFAQPTHCFAANRLLAWSTKCCVPSGGLITHAHVRPVALLCPVVFWTLMSPHHSLGLLGASLPLLAQFLHSQIYLPQDAIAQLQHPHLCVFDEAHHMGSFNSAWHTALSRIEGGRLALTGTLVRNSPMDAHQVIDWVCDLPKHLHVVCTGKPFDP